MSYESVRDTLTKITHRKPQPVFCPRCQSSNMKQMPTFGIMPLKFRCENCGYEGSIILELEKDKSGYEAI